MAARPIRIADTRLESVAEIFDRRSAAHLDRVAVCVCTYRRPAQLARLLESLASMTRPPATIFVVVDNDGGDPEVERLVARFRNASGAQVEYVLEPEPGISAARNTAFVTARSLGTAAIAMIDDDESATSDWLMKLLETRFATGAAVIGGPVQPVFPVQHHQLLKYERLWSVEKGWLDGRLYVSCTCNCLIDLSAAAALGDKPFPIDFGLTGGEDAVFFRRLHYAGVCMAWSEKAVVFEHVPEDRANIAWIRRRWYRQGNVAVRCERAVRAPRATPPLLKSVLLCLRLLIFPLANRAVLGCGLLWLLEAERIRGRLAAHLGACYQEYGRGNPP
jgi:succinoglycan biosynthesis protein ExoM